MGINTNRHYIWLFINSMLPYRISAGTMEAEQGCVAQSVTCLATDVSLTADPGMASFIPARSHTRGD